ncbi:MAG: hypothetical protein KA124_06115, partial [Luteimonas sp.]|nr:hypothetical protein [Luteimonas sp.]
MKVAAIEPATTPAEPVDGHGPSVVATLLARTLPAGSTVAVGWDDPLLGTGCSLSETATPALRGVVEAMLVDRAPAAAAHAIDMQWRDGDARIALAMQPGRQLPRALRDGWLALARNTIDATFAGARANLRIEGLRKSERLRQALYEIADLSGASTDMQDMLA